MKYRSDFVTNSSSSSFICVFPNKTYMNSQFAYLEEYFPRFASTIKVSIMQGKKTRKEIMEVLKKDYIKRAKYKFCYSTNEWLNLNYDMLNDPKVKQQMEEYVKDCLEKVEKRMPKRSYLAEVEYSDNDGEFFSELEHYVMPSLNFVVEVLNHH